MRPLRGERDDKSEIMLNKKIKEERICPCPDCKREMYETLTHELKCRDCEFDEKKRVCLVHNNRKLQWVFG